jgi:hypothetical protein
MALVVPILPTPTGRIRTQESSQRIFIRRNLIPSEGPFVIAPNYVSYLDPFFIRRAGIRRVRSHGGEGEQKKRDRIPENVKKLEEGWI